MNKLVLFGAGGHCKSVIDSIDRSQYEVVGILGMEKEVGKTLLDIKVIGTDDMAQRLYHQGVKNAFITVGSIGDYTIRKKLASLIKGIGFDIPIIIDKTAVVSKEVMIGQGTFIGKNAVVNTGAIINEYAIINSNATVEHDCRIKEFVHVGPSATLCGNVIVGYGSHIGAGATVINQLTIGKDVMLGAGGVATKNIDDHLVMYGNPARTQS